MPETSVKYAGVTLGRDYEGNIARFLETWQPVDHIPISDSAHRSKDYKDHEAIGLVNWPDPPDIRVNVLYWPMTGASRWAFCYMLVDELSLKLIDERTNYGTTPDMFELKVDDYVIELSMYSLQPRQITNVGIGPGEPTNTDQAQRSPGDGPQSAIGQPNPDDNVPRLWLLPLVCPRYYWQHIGLDLDFPEPDPNAEPPVEAKTWADLFQECSDALDSDHTVELPSGGIRAEYLYPDPFTFSRTGENVAVVLDAAAESVGCRIVYRLDGSVQVQQADSEGLDALQDNLALEARYIAGGYKFSDPPLPAQVCLNFQDHGDGVPEGTTQGRNICGSSPYEQSIGIDRTVQSTMESKVETEGENPTNLSEMTQLAERYAADWYANRIHEYDLTFGGTIEWAATVFDDYMIVRLFDELPATPEIESISNREDALESAEIVEQYRAHITTRIVSLPPHCGLARQYSVGTPPEEVVAANLWDFELTEDMGATEAKRAKGDIWRPEDPGETKTDVWLEDHPDEIFSILKDGNNGWAIEQGGKYWIVQSDCIDPPFEEGTGDGPLPGQGTFIHMGAT